jgi:hypothetical protein
MLNFSPKYTVRNGIIELKKVFEEKRIKNLNLPKFSNFLYLNNDINKLKGIEKGEVKDIPKLIDIKLAKMKDERDAVQSYIDLMSEANIETFQNYSSIEKFTILINASVSIVKSFLKGVARATPVPINDCIIWFKFCLIFLNT